MQLSPHGASHYFHTPTMTPVVKALIISCVAVYVVGVIFLQAMLWQSPWLFRYLGVVPQSLVESFFIWQPFTYMFVHAVGVFHLVFNMLMLFFLGCELERLWGSRFFAMYYVVCGVGAALVHVAGAYALWWWGGELAMLQAPVVGASGSVFGLLLAYGILYGDRVVYAFLLFPMKVKYFVMLLGGIELVSLLSSGRAGSDVAYLAHLGGLLTGYLFLLFYTWHKRAKRGPQRRRSRLTVVH